MQVQDIGNDPDMMEVGNGMKTNEDRAHFTMRAMLAAALIAGNDLADMSKETIEILTNEEIIAIDQDLLGIQGFKYKTEGDLEIWFKPLEDNAWAVTFLNRGDEDKKLVFDWNYENVVDELNDLKMDFQKNVYNMRDLWKHKNAGTTKSRFKRPYRHMMY